METRGTLKEPSRIGSEWEYGHLGKYKCELRRIGPEPIIFEECIFAR